MIDFIRRHAWFFWCCAVALQIPLLIGGDVFGKCFASFWLGAAFTLIPDVIHTAVTTEQESK